MTPAISILAKIGKTKFFRFPTLEPIVYKSHEFVDFVTDPPPTGLGLTLARLSKLVETDIRVLDKVATEAAGAHGGERSSESANDNIVIIEEPERRKAQTPLRDVLKKAKTDT